VVLELQGTRRLRTSVMAGETSPHWDERFEVLVADEVQKLRIVVKVRATAGKLYNRMAACKAQAAAIQI
jgi:hypothetical protein